jgi:hypothetical protein
MTKRSDADIVVTVPIEEYGFTGMTTSDLEAWLGVCGVSMREDYLGRPAITLEDAYKLREVQLRAEAEARANAELRAAVYSAQQRRNDVYAQAVRDALRGGRSAPDDFPAARQAGWRAVDAAEKDLPREVRDRLGGVPASFVTISS